MITVAGIQELLKVLPGIALLPFSIYFAMKKVGHGATASLSINSGRFRAAQVTSITIHNLKDKPLIIKAVHIVANKDTVITLEEFADPIIIKGHEAASIKLGKVSWYSGKEGITNDPFTFEKPIQIFISTPATMFKCKFHQHSKFDVDKKFKSLKSFAPSVQTYNGIVYGLKSKYAVTYAYEGKIRTTLMDRTGMMDGSWDFHHGMFNIGTLRNEEQVQQMLNSLDLGLPISNLIVTKLAHPSRSHIIKSANTDEDE